MNIRKLMDHSVTILPHTTTIRHAAYHLSSHEEYLNSHEEFVLVENHGLIEGIITTRNLVNAIHHNQKGSTPIWKIMTAPVVILDPELSVEEAIKIMDTQRLGHYPVGTHQNVVGKISEKRLVDYSSHRIKFHRNLQNIILMVFILFELSVFFLFAGGVT